MNIEALLRWERTPGEQFVDGHYHRTHRWTFDGGASWGVSSSPEIVPVPFSDPAHADPEELFVASISSCHMLFFLSLASRRKLVVDVYADSPVAILEKDDAGRMCVRRMILRPKVTFEHSPPEESRVIAELHQQAHASCFLANSVKTELTIEFDTQ